MLVTVKMIVKFKILWLLKLMVLMKGAIARRTLKSSHQQPNLRVL